VRLRRTPLYVASAGVLLLAGWPAAAAPHTFTFVMDKLKFGAVPTRLHKGDTLIFVNKDMFKHSATATDGHSFDVDLPPGAAKKMVLTKTGTIPFYCRYHPNMRAVLVIK
jgi:plastocyanin